MLVVLTDGEETCAQVVPQPRDVTVLHADQVGVADVIGAGRLVVSRRPRSRA